MKPRNEPDLDEADRPGPYDPVPEAADLWFLPDEDLADDPAREGRSPLPRADRSSVLNGRDWREAEAGVCAAVSGRREGQAALRDAAGNWSRAVARPVSAAGLAGALDGIAADRIALCLMPPGKPRWTGRHSHRSGAGRHPRSETAALILADAVTAKSLGWGHVLPLGLKPRDLHLHGNDLRLACHRAVVVGAGQAVSMAGEQLARAAARLHAVAPRLRSRAGGGAGGLGRSSDRGSGG